jgi:hypothetical protein
MERKNHSVTFSLPDEPYKAFRHKLTDEELTAKAVLPKLVELWVKGDIVLSEKPVKSTRGKKT